LIDEWGAIVSGAVHLQRLVRTPHLENMILLNGTRFEWHVKLVEKSSVILENILLSINNLNMFLDVKRFQDLGPTEDIFLVILHFHLVERVITCVLGMTTDVKYKDNGLEVAHLHKIRGKTQHDIIFVLTATVVDGNDQLLNRVAALPRPELIKQFLHDEGCNIVAYLLRSELVVGVAIQLVGRQAQVNNPEQVDCERRKVIYLPRLFASIVRHVHVLHIISDHGVLALTVWHFLGATLSGSQCIILNVLGHALGLEYVPPHCFEYLLLLHE
jgi:hypothetical protein